MKSWKTSLFGLGGGILNILANGGFTAPDGKFDWKTLVVSARIAGLGIFAKDHNVTGGDVHQ